MYGVTNLVEIKDRLTAATQEKGLQNAVTEYLLQTAVQFPDEVFPNGLQAGAAARIILQTAERYVSLRQERMGVSEVLSTDEIRAHIGENLKDLTMAQAVDYLALLQLHYNHFSPGAAVGITDEELAKEFVQLRMDASGSSLQGQVDRMVDTLDIERIGSLLRAVGDSIRQTVAEEGGRQILSLIPAEYCTYEELVLESTVLYAEAVRGNLDDVDPRINPGVLTAELAAYTDTLVLESKLAEQELTEAEADREMCELYQVLAMVMALAILLVLVLLGVEVSILTVSCLEKMGASEIVAAFAAGLVYVTFNIAALVKLQEYLPDIRAGITVLEEKWERNHSCRRTNPLGSMENKKLV